MPYSKKKRKKKKKKTDTTTAEQLTKPHNNYTTTAPSHQHLVEVWALPHAATVAVERSHIGPLHKVFGFEFASALAVAATDEQTPHLAVENCSLCLCQSLLVQYACACACVYLCLCRRLWLCLCLWLCLYIRLCLCFFFPLRCGCSIRYQSCIYYSVSQSYT